ncbi:heat-inducible transcriptional repressor HrcA [Oscillospiraceae bacterium OttesenSCG-928-G22]|nr:heat-inducible transcriptional repressor HrcA [Oscillospiraceae bacterium OttesenSCG-928-G22]
MPLGERKKLVLRAVVDDYIKSAEPVGSKTLVATRKLDLSSATVRNEMSELEQMGYLDKPHTSAGRVPSALGYRLYVDELMRKYRLTAAEMKAVDDALRLRIQEARRLISETGRLVAALTHYAAYATSPKAGAVRLRHVDILLIDPERVLFVIVLSTNSVKNKFGKRPNDLKEESVPILVSLVNGRIDMFSAGPPSPSTVREFAAKSGAPAPLVSQLFEFLSEALSELDDWDVYVGGMGNIFDHPEYMRDVEKAQRLLEHLSDPGAIKKMPLPSPEDKVKILIGPENVAEELRDASVMLASYELGDGLRGLIGIVGPTRMDYPRVEARFSYFIDRLNHLFRAQSDGEALPEESENE